MVLRLYESHGGSADAILTLADDYSSAHEANMLEQPTKSLKIINQKIKLRFRPFEIKTVILL